MHIMVCANTISICQTFKSCCWKYGRWSLHNVQVVTIKVYICTTISMVSEKESNFPALNEIKRHCQVDSWKHFFCTRAAFTPNLLVCPVQAAKQTLTCPKFRSSPISNFVSCFSPLYFWLAAVEAEQQVL